MKRRMDTLIRSVQQIERHLEEWDPCGRCTYRLAQDQVGKGRPEEGISARQTVLTKQSREEWLDRQGVMDYLRISDRTYYRLKANGTLQPHRFGRRDYYFIPELSGPLRESIRRGRV